MSSNFSSTEFSIKNFFNPFSQEFKEAEKTFHEDFSQSTWHWKQAVVVIASVIGGIFLIAGAFPVFRWTVTLLKSETSRPLETDIKSVAETARITPTDSHKTDNLPPTPKKIAVEVKENHHLDDEEQDFLTHLETTFSKINYPSENTYLSKCNEEVKKHLQERFEILHSDNLNAFLEVVDDWNDAYQGIEEGYEFISDEERNLLDDKENISLKDTSEVNTLFTLECRLEAIRLKKRQLEFLQQKKIDGISMDRPPGIEIGLIPSQDTIIDPDLYPLPLRGSKSA